MSVSDLNPGRPKYEAGMLTTRPRCSVCERGSLHLASMVLMFSVNSASSVRTSEVGTTLTTFGGGGWRDF
jgi:hypothetical protein